MMLILKQPPPSTLRDNSERRQLCVKLQKIQLKKKEAKTLQKAKVNNEKAVLKIRQNKSIKSS